MIFAAYHKKEVEKSNEEKGRQEKEEVIFFSFGMGPDCSGPVSLEQGS